MCEICLAAGRGDHASVIRLARRRKGWTQTELGQRVGFSHSEVSRFETRARLLRDVPVLRRFAVALELPGAVFGLGAPAGLRVCDEPSRGVEPVHRRQLLSGLIALAGAPLLPAAEVPRYRTAAAMRAGLALSRAEFDACRYQRVERRLPALVTSGHHVLDATAPGGAREQAEAVLADAYSLAAFTADKLGDWGLSWVLADRAREHAERSGNPLSLASATREAAVAIRRAGHHDVAARLLTTTAAGLSTATGWDLVGRGSLLLTAAYTHAQQGNAGTAIELADEAAEVAARLPLMSANAVFTADQVPIYRISIHNALGDPARALTVAREVNLGRLPSAERRARVCVDVARAWYGFGNAEGCLRALERAERYAPEEVRRAQIRRLTHDLLERPGPAPSGLRALAIRTGAVNC
jgi:transcriptional regulator with XRE-family HTH domain